LKTPGVELRHLQAFVAVGEALHFGRAAVRLQLSPSPVSRTVAELEREVGVPLFVRTHHRVQLTAEGAQLLPQARRLLAEWSAFTSAGRQLSHDRAKPRLRVGSPSLAPSGVVDRMIELLAEIAPETEVELEFAASVQLVGALRRGELDLVVAHLPLDEPELRILPVARYDLGLVVRVDDELADRIDVCPGDLAGRRVLMVSSAVQPATLSAISQWLSSVDAVVEQLPEPDLVRIAQLVRHGRGVTLSGRSGIAADIFRQPGLAIVPMRDAGPGVELALVWPERVDRSGAVELLVGRMAQLTSAELFRV